METGELDEEKMKEVGLESVEYGRRKLHQRVYIQPTDRKVMKKGELGNFLDDLTAGGTC